MVLTLPLFEPPASLAANQADATDEELNIPTSVAGSALLPTFEDHEPEAKV
jgi:hypothetical protein